jgi:hypothetical protein
VVILLAVFKVKEKLLRGKWKERIERIFAGLCMLAPPGFALGMGLLCKFYNPENEFLAKVNEIFSMRFYMGWETLKNYDIKLFGQYIEMHGNGGTLTPVAEYTFIDCSYLNILMRFGLVVFVLVILGLEIIMYKNRRNVFILGMILLICLHSMIEHHLFEFHYNIFMILPFALFEDKITETSE